MTIAFTINGRRCEVDQLRGDERLIDFLHDELNLTGTKLCCGIAVCRACTVSAKKPPNDAMVPTLACSTPLSLVDGSDITTIEGATPSGGLLPIQEAFLREFAFQCGYCTPGFVMASHIFLDQLAKMPLSREQLDEAIADAIGTHICRCTGYVRYYKALRKIAENFVKGSG
jgi:aerobic-type carbon monoxide dehydrogenase small subunit (CoxS/CutS family)